MRLLIKQAYLVSTCLFMISKVVLLCAQPDWWTEYSLVNESTRQDNAVATQGQAKHAVKKAYQYLDAELIKVGGVGTEITALYINYCTTAPTNAEDDLLPLSIGQLKYLAKPFYDRLNSETVDFNNLTGMWGRFCYPTLNQSSVSRLQKKELPC